MRPEAPVEEESSFVIRRTSTGFGVLSAENAGNWAFPLGIGSSVSRSSPHLGQYMELYLNISRTSCY